MTDMARLPETVKSMKPLLDRDFIAYLNYAIDVEREVGFLRQENACGSQVVFVAFRPSLQAIVNRNLDPEREPSEWLQVIMTGDLPTVSARWLTVPASQVLGIIKKGVYAELGKDVRQDVQVTALLIQTLLPFPGSLVAGLQAITYVLRMPDPETQRLLLEQTIETLPTWDVRQFHKAGWTGIGSVALSYRTDVLRWPQILPTTSCSEQPRARAL